MGISSMAFHSKSYDLREFIEEGCHAELLFHDDGYPDENDEYWIRGDNILWNASVRFPKEYLPEFEGLLRKTLGDA
jgi:hypothetical protein